MLLFVRSRMTAICNNSYFLLRLAPKHNGVYICALQFYGRLLLLTQEIMECVWLSLNE